MAEDSVKVAEAKNIVWGSATVSGEVVERWLQGFTFSESEPTALIQRSGGPCGILAAVQALLLRLRVYPGEGEESLPWRSEQGVEESLTGTLAHMLDKAWSQQEDNPIILCQLDDSDAGTDLDAFHKTLRFSTHTSRDETEGILMSLLEQYQGPFGILLFLYSMVLTRGVEQIREDQSDTEPLVTMPHGHASQALVNLMLTGSAVPEVYDGEQDHGGLVIRGIAAQAEVGYLTLLESLRYCAVGSNYKSPKHPIWVLGSESHFTVLFSMDQRLVQNNNPLAQARRVMSKYDPASNGFVQLGDLVHVLRELNKPHAEQDVQQVSDAVDPEGLGIILIPKLLDHLYPGVSDTGTPASFTLYHYNGIQLSGQQVIYRRGVAEAKPAADFGATDIVRCLRTKWPDVSIQWQDGEPSMH